MRLDGCRHCAQENLAIDIVAKDVGSRVAARREVIQGARKLEPQRNLSIDPPPIRGEFCAAPTWQVREWLNRARRSVVSGKRFALDRGEPVLDLVGKRAVAFDELGRERASALEERPVTT